MYEEIEERDNVKTRLRYIVHNKNLVNNDQKQNPIMLPQFTILKY